MYVHRKPQDYCWSHVEKLSNSKLGTTLYGTPTTTGSKRLSYPEIPEGTEQRWLVKQYYIKLNLSMKQKGSKRHQYKYTNHLNIHPSAFWDLLGQYLELRFYQFQDVSSTLPRGLWPMGEYVVTWTTRIRKANSLHNSDIVVGTVGWATMVCSMQMLMNVGIKRCELESKGGLKMIKRQTIHRWEEACWVCHCMS